MKLRAPTFQVDEQDPFKFDLLDRKPSAIALLELIKSCDEPLVLGIDAEWGQGKTTFLEMWRTLLTNNGIKNLYFNSWENDFSDSAFVSLMGDLELGMRNLKINNNSKVKESFAAAKKVGARIIQRALPTSIKIATAGMIDVDDLFDDAVSDLGEKIAEERIKKYEESKSSVTGFRAALTKFALEITKPIEGNSQTPLVIVIDELDRCKPSYAIDVLETVKHFFSVPNVTFVIAADWNQIENAVRQRYGIQIDVSGYLRRFIDINFSMPVPNDQKFCVAQFERFGFNNFFASRTYSETRYDSDHIRDTFSHLFSATGCSLRDQERCFALLGLAIRTTPENQRLNGLLLATLIVLKIKNPSLYKNFTRHQLNHQKVIDYFSSGVSGRALFEETSGYGVAIEAFLANGDGERDHSRAIIDQYVSITQDTARPESIRERASNIVNLLRSHEFRDSYKVVNRVVKKIDLLA